MRVIYGENSFWWKPGEIYKSGLSRNKKCPQLTHPWPSSKSKFNLKSDRLNLLWHQLVLLNVCFIYPMSGRFKLGPKRLTRPGNSNVLRLPVTDSTVDIHIKRSTLLRVFNSKVFSAEWIILIPLRYSLVVLPCRTTNWEIKSLSLNSQWFNTNSDKGFDSLSISSSFNV